jgi:hypothetical protein
MPDLGKKYTCYSCHTKFYDLGKPVPLCPKCGADQRDADDAPVIPTGRSRSRAAAAPPPPVVEDVADEGDFAGEGEPAAGAGEAEDEDEIIAPDEREEEPEEEEEEEY